MNVRKIVVFFLVIVVTGALGFLAVNGAEWGIYELKPLADQIPRGLDLTGGVSVVYEAKDLESESLDVDLDAAKIIMRMRLDEQGYTEATISEQGRGRLRLEIPINESNMVEDPATITQYLVKPAKVEFKEEDGNVVFTGSDMVNVGVDRDPDNVNQFVVAFSLNEAATKAFAEATARAVAKAPNNGAISIVLDGEVISSPVVNTVIATGSATITSPEFVDREAVNLLAQQLRSGALPLEMEEIEVRSVSATLGEEALQRGLLAGVIGLLLIFVFMIVYYRLPGVVSVIALVIYMIIVLFCLATIPGVQLTLPGIAGIILSIGMAVDANVIIFERMREELYANKTIRTSVKMGFQRAFTAIMDSNITTVIAALVLLFFGTGSIKGFATTLLIGIVVSFITAVFITRGLMNLLLGFHVQNKALFCPKKKEESKEEKKKKPRFQFTKRLRVMLLISALVMVAGLGVGLFSGGLNLGVDFTGGTLVSIDIQKVDYDMDVVTDALDASGIVGAQAMRTGETTSAQTMVDIRMPNLDDDTLENEQRANLLKTIQQTYPEAAIKAVDRVDGVASGDLIRNAFLSVLIASVLILVYVWFRFELLSGCAAVLALVHDVAIMIALTCILRVPVNSPFIAAVLTIVGYSINNTIVIFDRIRENRKSTANPDKNVLDIVDRSIHGTLARSINTSITTLLTITMVYILGVESIRQFALPIIVGLLAGTYSSIFLAGPLWGSWMSRRFQKSKNTPAHAKAGKKG